MTPDDMHAALTAIEYDDPVARLAERLITAGWTEQVLSIALGSRKGSPIGNELQNKFRDTLRGTFTENKYGRRYERHAPDVVTA